MDVRQTTNVKPEYPATIVWRGIQIQKELFMCISFDISQASLFFII